MANRCLNKVMLIGNLTRDPELRYTPAGVAVCTFGVATNRRWTTQGGEQKEDAQFHRIVTWNRLAELCSQLLAKGRRVYLEGRLQYREYTNSEGDKKQVTEMIAENMIILDSRQATEGEQTGEQLEGELDKVAAYGGGKGETETTKEGTGEEKGATGETEEKPAGEAVSPSGEEEGSKEEVTAENPVTTTATEPAATEEATEETGGDKGEEKAEK